LAHNFYIMKFELKPDNRNSSDEDLIKDVIEAAKKLDKRTISGSEYNAHGRYNRSTIINRFGSWRNAVKRAGLFCVVGNHTDSEILNEIRRVSELPTVNILTREIFNKNKKFSNTHTIEKRFGSWTQALKKAGLKVSPAQKKGYSEINLFENLLEVWTYHGNQPTTKNLSEYPSKISLNTYQRHFGSWRNALEAFVEYANKGQAEAFIKPNNKTTETPENKSIKCKRIQHKTSRTINLRLRFLVMKQNNFKCKNCGRSPATDHSVILHVDHIHPWSKGGETVIENLQTLCSKCNLGKSNL